MKAFKSYIRLYAVAALGAGALFTTVALQPAQAQTQNYSIPTVKVARPGQQTATFAAGCFWSMEAIFKQLKGVASVEPGYAGGRLQNPSYQQVETGRTGHAETVNIIFDPKVISYYDLLEVLLTVRDPTTVNQQGPDYGPQYRSVIFARNAQQRQTALKAIQDCDEAQIWNAPAVTEVQPFSNFYRAEDYHLDYYNLHPQETYCARVVAPEIADFREKFHDKLKQ
ncbi:peptide-methionine (S)-S-oxide reductase [bacterium]|nr:MAG: peptide-methionine (S)-S-oxide reductase [bacterium]